MRRTIQLAALAIGGLLLPVQPAVASCAPGIGPESSPVIFVGTAESERRGYTRFAVDEVQAGPDLAPDVWVRSGQEQPTWPLSMLSSVGSSTDADFNDGKKYVVGASESFVTDACLIMEASGSTRITTAREPVDDGASGADPPLGPLGQTLWVAGSFTLVVAALGLLRRRRRQNRLGVTSTD